MSELEPNGPGPSAANVARSALQIARAGNHEHAARILRQRLGQSPLAAGEAAELRLVLARVMLDSGHAKAAVAELVQVLQIDAHRPDALLLLTEALIECREGHRAIDILERAARSGGDPNRIAQLRAALDALGTGSRDAKPAANPSKGHLEGMPVLIAQDPFGDDLDTPRTSPRFFPDDEETVPWFSDSLDQPATKPTPSPAHVPASLFSSAEERAVVGTVDLGRETFVQEEMTEADPDATLDGRGSDAKSGGLPVVYRPTSAAPEYEPDTPLRPGSEPITDPLGWSIGDPGRAAVGRNVPAPLIFDDNESTVTGSFHGLGQSVLEDVRRQVEAFRDRREPTAEREVTPQPGPRHTPIPTDSAIALGSSDMLDPDFAASQVILLSSGEIETLGPAPAAAPRRNTPTASTAAVREDQLAPHGFSPSISDIILQDTEPVDLAQLLPSQRAPAGQSRPHSQAMPPVAQSQGMPVAQSQGMPVAQSQGMPAQSQGMPAQSQGMPLAQSHGIPVPRRPTDPPPHQDLPPGVISDTNVPIRPRSRRHDHVARNSDPIGQFVPPPRPQRPPQVFPPAPSLQAHRRQDLEAKLAVAQRRQVSRQETDQHIRAARTFAWGALVPLAVIVLGTAVLLVAALIFWPAAHHEAVVAVLDHHGETARQSARKDTYGGYLAASENLGLAIAATGPGGPEIAGVTEGYLSALGVDDIKRLKLAALADMAETHAILEVRFGHSADPSSLALLARLEGTNVRSPQASAAKGWRLLGRGDLEAALAGLDADIGVFPSSANLHYLRGECLDRMGDHDLARQAWERAQVLDARHVPTRVALGTWHARRRSQLATDLFADVLDRLSPGHPGATIERATYWIDTGQNTRQAREALDRVLDASQPLSAVERAQAHYARGLWFDANSEPAKAADEFAAALRLDASNPMAAAARIKLLIEEDDLDAAETALDESTGRGGNQERLRTLRALWLLRSGEPAKARAALGAVSGTNPVAQRLLGDVLVELGEWKAAESAFNRAVALGDRAAAPDLHLARAVRGNADALLHLQADTVKTSNAATSWRYGRARLERGDLDTALVHLEKAHRIDPQGTFRHRIPAVADLCRLHEAKGEITEARRACDEAIARRPALEPPHRIRARIASIEGDDATAYGLLTALVARRPGDRAVALELIRAQIHQGRLSEANAAIEQLMSKQEASADLHVLQGLLEYARYRHGFALGYFQRALAARSDDAEAHAYAARCLLATGRPGAAAEHIRAARKDPAWTVPALSASSEYHRQLGDARSAISDAGRALRAARRRVTPPRHVAEAHAALAQGLEMRKGATDPAVTEALESAARLDHAPAFYHLARIAVARRDRRTYLKALQDAVDRDPFLCPAVALLRREVQSNPKLDVRVPDTCR